MDIYGLFGIVHFARNCAIKRCVSVSGAFDCFETSEALFMLFTFV